MLLQCEPLPVADLEIAVGCSHEITTTQSCVHVVADRVWIAGTQAVLNDETACSACDLRSSLQFCLCDTVHGDTYVAAVKALVGELSNGSEDILVGISTESDILGGHSAERALISGPAGLRVDLLGQILTQGDAELGLNEAHQVEICIVDGHVADRHCQTYTVRRGDNLGKIKYLVCQGLYLTKLLHFNVIGTDRPHLVADYAGNNIETNRESESLMEGGDHLVDCQVNGTTGLDIGSGISSSGVQKDLTVGLACADILQELTEAGCLLCLHILLAGGHILILTVESSHLAIKVLEFTGEIHLLDLLLVSQFTACGLNIQVAEFLVDLS